MGLHHASPLQLKTGEWGAWVRAPNVRNGDKFIVVARSGSSWEAVVVGVVWQGPEAAICQTARGLMQCGWCGEVGQKGAYPFSTYPAEMQRCDDCGFGMKTPATSRRKRFYAYERRSGGQCYFDKAMHAYLQRYPHTIGHYQLTRFLGTSALLTSEEAAAQAWLPMSRQRAL